jgi:hypothetical protein
LGDGLSPWTIVLLIGAVGVFWSHCASSRPQPRDLPRPVVSRVQWLPDVGAIGSLVEVVWIGHAVLGLPGPACLNPDCGVRPPEPAAGSGRSLTASCRSLPSSERPRVLRAEGIPLAGHQARRSPLRRLHHRTRHATTGRVAHRIERPSDVIVLVPSLPRSTAWMCSAAGGPWPRYPVLSIRTLVCP